MLVTSNSSPCAIIKALLANELPDLGNPSITSCVSGVTMRERSWRNSRYKEKKDGGVSARVNLEPLFEPKGDGVFVQMWSQPLLIVLIPPSFALPSSDLRPSILHTVPEVEGNY